MLRFPGHGRLMYAEEVNVNKLKPDSSLKSGRVLVSGRSRNFSRTIVAGAPKGTQVEENHTGHVRQQLQAH